MLRKLNNKVINELDYLGSAAFKEYKQGRQYANSYREQLNAAIRILLLADLVNKDDFQKIYNYFVFCDHYHGGVKRTE